MRVLIADDHPMVRDALARAVRSLDTATEIAEAANFAAACSLCASFAPDLALIDLHMPGADGLSGLQRLRREFPSLSLIVASGQDDPATIRAALAHGARGFFPKSESAGLLAAAIEIVRRGGTYIPPGALGDWTPGPPANGATGLTPRQLDVLQRLLRGEPNKQIARDLGLTEGTVKIHVAAILRTLRARNRTEAVIQARALGLEPGEPT